MTRKHETTLFVGLNSFSLGLTSSTLVAGLRYVFTLSASYDMNPTVFMSSSQITVKMNIPQSSINDVGVQFNYLLIYVTFLERTDNNFLNILLMWILRNLYHFILVSIAESHSAVYIVLRIRLSVVNL